MIKFKPAFHPIPVLVLAMILGLATWCTPSVYAQDFTFPMHSQDEATLGSIVITGNERTHETVIARILGLEIGQLITRRDVDDAWDRLEDSGYFRTVDVHLDDSEEPAVIRIHVEEDMTTYYGPLIRYDRRHKYLLGGWIEERNFRGQGEKVRLEAAALYSQQAKLTWQHPWFLGRDGLSVQWETAYQQGDFVYRPTDFRKWDTQALLRQEWGGMFFVTTGVTYGQFEQLDAFSWQIPQRGNSSPSGLELWPEATESHWLVEGSLGLDSRSNPYYPSRGVFLEGRVRSWSSDNFPSYLETSLDGRLFVPVPWKHHVLALHAWGRRTDGAAQLDNLLYFGGPETVRGEPYALREGDEGYLLSVEYRIPLFLMPISPQGELVGVGIHLFADAGDAWFDGADPGQALQSAGAGLHLNLDTLQLRFEAARTRAGHWGFEFMDKFNF